MDVIQLFKQAAKELQNDDRYTRLEKARIANDQDKQLQEKIGEFNLLRLDLDNELEKEISNKERVNELNDKVREVYSEIMTNPNMLEYTQAKQEMESLFNYVSAILNAAVDGQDPMDVEEPEIGGCSPDGCSSCSGCG